MFKFTGTSKEKFFYHNTLLCLVKSLEGKNITLDLRNDSTICGLVTAVDGYMNISLSNAVFVDPQENEYAFETLFVQARNIRYVHIPETMPIIPTINKELSKTRMKAPDKKPIEKSRKAKKALQRHMETVALLE
ncbi:U7 snRNA-associated Sm-like protein LSm10 [Ostrinia nubilalis]|uniref:U7 snRNA-associated Sm-like protein LSm10 n=1 Tax=Ostrinia nubilalis TaxID=29057 RepID=UPI0030823B09